MSDSQRYPFFWTSTPENFFWLKIKFREKWDGIVQMRGHLKLRFFKNCVRFMLTSRDVPYPHKFYW